MKCAKRISLAVLFSCCVFSFAQTTTPSEAVPEAPPKATASYGPLEVLTDTTGVDFSPYLKRVLEDVKVNWYNLVPKSAKAPTMKKGKVTIEFAIRNLRRCCTRPCCMGRYHRFQSIPTIALRIPRRVPRIAIHLLVQPRQGRPCRYFHKSADAGQ